MNKELLPNTILSHYRIISKIGAGGMGEVYLAEDTKLARKVALKILPSEFAQDLSRMNRFVREAKSASALNHPNIITIYEINEFENTHFIATEFIDGRTLNDYAEENSLNYKSALEIAIQIVSALDEAHVAGIVHRDIKPDNVMIRPNGLVKILDFGIAKSIPEFGFGNADWAKSSEESETLIQTDNPPSQTPNPNSTAPGMIIGTANYMSPEQAKGKVIDARTDIFSFGVVLYEMIAGKLPFEGENALEMIGAILHKESKPLSSEVPAEISRIISKCLRKDRDERYQTIKDVGNDLKEVKQELELKNLIERTASPDKPKTKTQILQAATVDEINQTTTNQTVLGNPIKKYLVAGLLTLMLAVGGFFGYKYFAPTANKQIESIAVMPFVNESGNADIDYLSDGMTETLIKSLSQIPNLNVKPRSSVFRYKGKSTDLQTIAKELNIQKVLNGRIVQRGDQITLSLELVDVQKDSVIWTENYSRRQSDLVLLQSEIAKDVSTNLKAKLTGTEEIKVTKPVSSDAEAYQAYLKGRYYWNRRTAENLKKAIEQFKIATDRDPNYALAFAGLADCYAMLNFYAGTPISETLPQAKSFAERAIALDDQLGEPHATLGSINQRSWEWTESEREYKRAIELNPDYATAYQWYSRLLRNLGRYDEAAAMIKRAHELDPLSSVISDNVAEVYQIQNNYQACVEISLKVIELDPNFTNAHINLGISYLKQGRTSEAVASLEKGVKLSNRAAFTLVDLGYAYGVTGRRTEALALIKELEEKYAKGAPGRYIAAVYAELGDKDKAFEWLEKDFQNKADLAAFRWEVPYESLRDDPRFQDLLKRMGLPE